MQRRWSSKQVWGPDYRQISRSHARAGGGEGEAMEVAHQVSESAEVRFGHPFEQRRNLLPLPRAEADGTDKGSVQGVSAKGFRKLAKEKLQEWLIKEECCNDMLTNFEHGSNGVGAGNMGFTWLLPRIDCSFEGGHCARLAGQPVDSLTCLP